MGSLARTSDHLWERAGMAICAVAWCSISAQIWHEWRTAPPTSLSWVNLFGFLFIFAFWTAYGVRFGRVAVWVGNAVAVCLQAVLIVVCLGNS